MIFEFCVCRCVLFCLSIMLTEIVVFRFFSVCSVCIFPVLLSNDKYLYIPLFWLYYTPTYNVDECVSHFTYLASLISSDDLIVDKIPAHSKSLFRLYQLSLPVVREGYLFVYQRCSIQDSSSLHFMCLKCNLWRYNVFVLFDHRYLWSMTCCGNTEWTLLRLQG